MGQAYAVFRFLIICILRHLFAYDKVLFFVLYKLFQKSTPCLRIRESYIPDRLKDQIILVFSVRYWEGLSEDFHLITCIIYTV